MMPDDNPIAVERRRIEIEYQRREKEIPSDLYAPWQAATSLINGERKRIAAMMLKRAGVFPKAGDQCLEVGYGSLGWFADLLSWGVPETSLHGIELNRFRAKRAQELLPKADLRVGDATALPWAENTFRIIIASTVFTSILDSAVRQLLANEITRVLAPGGAFLWYDFAVDNPKNPHVRGVNRKELKNLFHQLNGKVKSATLAPPLARLVAPKSWLLATVLEAIPLFRTHLIGVLIKPV